MKSNRKSIQEFSVEIDPAMIEALHPLLQQGVRVKVNRGASIESLLCDTIGVSREYIEEKVQTIFLDGKAVDDLGATALVDGSRVALSAAMPGLAGAIMRRGGFFASMRSGISYRPEEASMVPEPCFVTVLVFNMLVREMAPQFLAHGVWVTTEELTKILQSLPQDVLSSSAKVRTTADAVGVNELHLSELFPPDALVFVKVSQEL